jgi:hypothetical protein
LIELECERCGNRFKCNGDKICATGLEKCLCKKCSKGEDAEETEQCYGGITERETVEFT